MAELTVARIAHGPLLSCSTETSLIEAVRRMYAARCSSIVVVEGDAVLGIWTEKDVLAVDLSDPTALARPIREVMSHPVKTIAATATVGEATSRMKEARIRHFLVVDDDGTQVGVISQTDIVLNQGLEYFLHLKDVNSAIGRDFLRLPEDMPVRDAAARLRRRRADAAAISYGDGSYGILTERDVVKLICQGQLNNPVGAVASRPLVTVPVSSSLFQARNILAERHIRHLGVTDEDGELLALLSFPDILNTIEQGYIQELQSTLRQREEALTLSRGRLRLVGKVFESTAEGIVITDADGIIQSANPAFQRLSGYEEHEMVGQNARMFSSGRQDKAFYQAMWRELKTKGYWKGEIWNRRKNGEIFLKTMTITGIRDTDGAFCNYAAVHSDVISHEQNLERIHYLANHDALTGLPNRSQLHDHLGRALAAAKRRQSGVAVLVFDIDRFKTVNETLGYLAGDELLQAVAALLTATVDEDCLVARIHADEFALVVEGMDGAGLAELAGRLLHAMARPITVRGCLMYVTASIGVSAFPADGDDLLQSAATAAEQAKGKGRGTYQFFTEEMNSRSRRRISIEAELRRALDGDELRVHYQPKVAIGSMAVTGMEALVRWQHPERGLLPPGEFIPVAEEAGLVTAVNEWVLEHACRDLRRWSDAGISDLSVAVNLSPCQFRQPDFVAQLRDALTRANLPSSRLELEITESMAMESADVTIRTLQELSAAGLAVAIDDFGTGYSSFSYLKRYPVSALKIDRSFIYDMQSDDDVIIPRAIISMAHSLGIKVVAEGIETQYQLDALRCCGCDVGQGYLFSKPLPPEEFLRFYLQTQPAAPELAAAVGAS